MAERSPRLESKAFRTDAPERPPLTIALAIALGLWMLVAIAQGASPAAEVRYGAAIWPFTLLFISGLIASLYALWRRKRWLPWMLGATFALDVGFALIRGELSLAGVVLAVGLLAVSLAARAEWG